MSNRQKWQILTAYAKSKGLRYVSWVAVIDDEIRFRSYYATIFDVEFLKIFYGKHAEEEGIKLLKMSFHGGNLIGKVYEDYVRVILPSKQPTAMLEEN